MSSQAPTVVDHRVARLARTRCVRHGGKSPALQLTRFCDHELEQRTAAMRQLLEWRSTVRR